MFVKIKIFLKTIVLKFFPFLLSDPDFIFAGTNRSGTTSLYSLFSRQKFIYPPSKKEPHFFSLHYKKGLSFYKIFFPTKLEKIGKLLKYRKKIFCFEASPDYFYTSKAPERIFKTYPKLKICITLRDPIDRAISLYAFFKFNEREKESTFLKQIKSDIKLIKEVFDGEFKCDDEYRDWLMSNTCLAGGLYLDCIKRWDKFFDRDQMLLIQSEKLFEKPDLVLKNMVKYLEIPYTIEGRFENVRHSRIGKKQILNVSERQEYLSNGELEILKSFYSQYNKKLYQYLGRKFKWQ